MLLFICMQPQNLLLERCDCCCIVIILLHAGNFVGSSLNVTYWFLPSSCHIFGLLMNDILIIPKLFAHLFLHFLFWNWLQLQVPVVLNYSYRGTLALRKWLKAQRRLHIRCICLSAASRPELLTGHAITVLNI